MATTPRTEKPEKKAETPRQTKAQKAQAALDVIVRKITKADTRIARAQKELDEATAEREELLREKDYAASNPALPSNTGLAPEGGGTPTDYPGTSDAPPA